MTPMRRVLEALRAQDCTVRERGQGYSAQCPAHEDRAPSLSVDLGRDGRVLLRCFAGCEVPEIVAALGLDLGGLFEPDEFAKAPDRLASVPTKRASEPPAPLPSTAQLEMWEASLHGWTKLLARAAERKGWTRAALAALGVGWNGERFTLPIHNSTGALVNVCSYLPGGRPKLRALRGRPRDLFPAPELLDGQMVTLPGGERVPVVERQPIYLVEGEADAISGLSVGLLAIAVPGAQGWRSEWAPRFAGMNVRVLCDHDDAGARLARGVAEDLAAAGVSVDLLDWPVVAGRQVPTSFDLGDYCVAQSPGERVAA